MPRALQLGDAPAHTGVVGGTDNLLTPVYRDQQTTLSCWCVQLQAHTGVVGGTDNLLIPLWRDNKTTGSQHPLEGDQPAHTIRDQRVTCPGRLVQGHDQTTGFQPCKGRISPHI